MIVKWLPRRGQTLVRHVLRPHVTVRAKTLDDFEIERTIVPPTAD
jgi:hypothetical protein